ncbi:MAG TPA: serine/threonine-protein kinase [Gemmatimonadales bacterium]|jgi:serine/threonine-protein kinase|nr:serine/threonine-protein kinase [Gemmatimonadales bacterium]
MHEHVTLLRPGPRSADGRGLSSGLPADLLDQVRGRVRLLAGFVFVASSLDPLLFLISGAVGLLRGDTPPPEFLATIPFRLVDVAMASASAGLWWVARSRQVSPSRLYTLGLAYEITICFTLALTTYWQFYLGKGVVAGLTWVPAVVILFPLIIPGPPRRMLIGAILAAAMAPLALLVLDLWGKVPTDPDGYLQAVISSGFAVGFAFMGARVVYRLGREVAAARELGSYRLEEQLGQGGMGEVWRARHRMLARPAAIKLIRPTLTQDGRAGASDEARHRFEREAQAIARLRSPHTVNLFDFGVADDGAFYYAMELLDGLDADTLVRRFGPLPAERVVYLLRQICHSLSEADSCGLVHRDIKPANIFICRYGEDHDFVKVLDFGLVKTLGDLSEPAAAPGLTRENFVHGTPAFIAPEQALGAGDLDGRVDVYATGCVAYWLLTGQLVFTADTPMGLVLHHAHTAPAPPSSRVELPIPASLDRLVLDCLAKERSERPQSAKELLRRLDLIEVPGPWTEERAGSWWATHEPSPAPP